MMAQVVKFRPMSIILTGRTSDDRPSREAVLGVHPIERCRRIEVSVWPEPRQRAPPLGHPHVVAGNIPHRHGEVSCFRGETHQVRALTQRFFRASFLFDDGYAIQSNTECRNRRRP
jgi:hypothetical protein